MFHLRSLVVNSKTSANRLLLPAAALAGNNFALHRKFCEKMANKDSVNSIIDEVKAGLQKLESEIDRFISDDEKQNTSKSKPTANLLHNANGIDEKFMKMKKEMKELRDGNDHLNAMLTQLQKNFNAMRDEKQKNPIEKLDQTKTANSTKTKTLIRLSAAILLCFAAYYVYVRLNSLQQMAESLQLESIISNFISRKNNKWNASDSSPGMDIAKDGLTLTHSGPKYADISVCSAIPLPKLYPMPHKPEYILGYFEAKLHDYHNPLIGYCDKEYPLKKTEIGYRKNSIALRTQGMIQIEGKNISMGKDASKEYRSFNEGDVLGIGIVCSGVDDRRKLKCFATHNGSLLGTVDLPSHFHDLQLFPAVSLGINGTSIKANFGNEKWRFDPAQLVQYKENQ